MKRKEIGKIMSQELQGYGGIRQDQAFQDADESETFF